MNAPAKIILLHIGPFNPLEVSHAWSLVKGRRHNYGKVRPRSNQMAFYYFWSCLTKIHGDDHVVLLYLRQQNGKKQQKAIKLQNNWFEKSQTSPDQPHRILAQFSLSYVLHLNIKLNFQYSMLLPQKPNLILQYTYGKAQIVDA